MTRHDTPDREARTEIEQRFTIESMSSSRRRFMKVVVGGSLALAASVFPELREVGADHQQYCNKCTSQCCCTYCCRVHSMGPCQGTAVNCGAGRYYFQLYIQCDGIFNCGTYSCSWHMTGPWVRCSEACCCPSLALFDDACFYCVLSTCCSTEW